MSVLYTLLLLSIAATLTGCAVTSHPQFEKTYFKANVSDAQVQEVIKQFKSSGLGSADVGKDTLGRLILTGEYKNENEVEQAFAILEKSVGIGNYATVRPSKIKVLRWEIEAGKEFEKYIKALGARYKMAVSVESDGSDKQLNITNLGLDGAEQFAFASDNPTAKAEEFYKRLAAQWKASAGHLSGSKKILIVGHTDDIGDTRYNMNLSERRARAIGQIFANAGFPSSNLYYQGAGEVLPIASNETSDGRVKNRRVEIAELSDAEALRLYETSRRAPVALYRYEVKKIVQPSSNSGVNSTPQATSPNKTGPKENTSKQGAIPAAPVTTESTPPRVYTNIDFGGVPYTPQRATLNISKDDNKKSAFSFISHARAQDINALSDCTKDRPRSIGAIKTLDTGAPQNRRPTDYMQGIDGRTWYGTTNNNAIVFDYVYVLRDNGESPVSPKMKAYEKYNNNPNQKPSIETVPSVNSYLVGNGVLYRVFPAESTGVKCMDILLPVKGQGRADQGLIVYNQKSGTYVADYKPQASY
jgi:outer membrane protein OmpA-like peptidoglycan-associated protein